MIPAFETTFAVPLSCEACIKHVSTSLYKLDGISHVSADLKSQLISVTGTAAPSSIAAAIQDTGRDAILRGSGKTDAAAVCILETHSKAVHDPVRGLIRMVQVSKDMTIIDLTIKGLSQGTYNVTVREAGNIERGAETTGGIWDYLRAKDEDKPASARGIWGTVQVNKTGIGAVFLDKPIQIWDMIGRSIVVSKKRENEDDYGENVLGSRDDPDTLVGVVARSAGVWDNDKTVCSCSGKTVWEERTEQVGKGML
ncbi:superoxide dismutase copper chaperone-like protein [Delphinella strobiligena]|nr:superoxide dismutase copper chaperone-like protein [Delphinella strobiligena]